jgi:hypothetical protein
MNSAETMFYRMREDELVARTRYHADRLREAERVVAFHQAALEAARADLEAVRMTRERPGVAVRGLPPFISKEAPLAHNGHTQHGATPGMIAPRVPIVAGGALPN